MLAASLSQPWCWAVLDELVCKHLENRSWPPYAGVVGTRIGIHAAKSWDPDGLPFLKGLGLTTPTVYVKGAMMGTAIVDRVVTDVNDLPEHLRRWFFRERKDGKKNYGWILREVRRLKVGVECKGAQGLWTIPPLVEAAMRGMGGM